MYRNYDIKPVKTEYKGIVFRSKLEAQWAVFFYDLKIKYLYEPEGFITDYGSYCPDFFLPEIRDGMYIEIKPTKATDFEYKKLQSVANQTNKLCVFMIGSPSTNNHDHPATDDKIIIFPQGGEDNRMLFCQCQTCGKFGIEFDGRGDRICRHDKDGDKGYSFDCYRIKRAINRSEDYNFKNPKQTRTIVSKAYYETSTSLCGENGCDGRDCVICTEIGISML